MAGGLRGPPGGAGAPAQLSRPRLPGRRRLRGSRLEPRHPGDRLRLAGPLLGRDRERAVTGGNSYRAHHRVTVERDILMAALLRLERSRTRWANLGADTMPIVT